MADPVPIFRTLADMDAYYAGLAATSKSSGRVEAVSTLRDRTPTPQAEPLQDAEVIWGKPSSFTWGNRAADFANGPDTRINSRGTRFQPDPEAPDDPGVPQPLEEEWVELSRVERQVRITGTGGAYVDFKRIDEITWQLPSLPDGRPHIVTQKLKKFGDE